MQRSVPPRTIWGRIWGKIGKISLLFPSRLGCCTSPPSSPVGRSSGRAEPAWDKCFHLGRGWMGKWGISVPRAIPWLLKMFVRDGVAAEVSSPSPCPSQPVVLPFSFGPTLHTQMIRGCFLRSRKSSCFASKSG